MLQGWTFRNWGVLGWVETALKGSAIVIGIVAFSYTSGSSELTIGGNPRLFSIAVLALLTVATLLQIGLRLKLKDILALVFAVAYFIGHAGMLLALLRDPATARPLAQIFGGLILLGDVVKLRWLGESGYTEGGAQTPQLVRLVTTIVLLYALFTIGIMLG
jgi:hypothetical protein